jgi:hypothetical protein
LAEYLHVLLHAAAPHSDDDTAAALAAFDALDHLPVRLSFGPYVKHSVIGVPSNEPLPKC